MWHGGAVPPATFDTLDRTDGSVLGSFPLSRDAEVRAALEAARAVVPVWAGATVALRSRLLRAWRGELWRSSARLAELLHREGGVAFDDAMLEVVQVVEHLKWVEANATRVLGTSPTPRTRFSPELSTSTSYVPEGVVGVVTSGRPALYAAASAVACALVAGNPVVLQPGVRSTATLAAYVEAFAGANPDAPAGLLQLLTGDDATAVALAGAPLDRVCFLGPPVGGVRVSTAAARALVPVSVVPVVAPVTLVAPDADLTAAAEAVAGAARGGDPDLAQEVFVAPSVLDDFRVALTRATSATAEQRRGALSRALGRRSTGPAELAAPPAEVRVQSAPGFDVLVERLRAHPSAQVAVHSAKHGRHLAELLSAAEVTVNLSVPASGGGIPRTALGARGYGPFSGDDGLRTYAKARTTTSRRRLPLPLAPVEVLLATPPGRVAARFALHVRHSLD